jgi:CheY-like chemotaxis protein
VILAYIVYCFVIAADLSQGRRTLPTWMVVEDEPDIYDVLLAMFEIWGIEGVAFVDGAEAVAWIENVDQGRVRGELPELAILDIRLPEISGPEVGQRLRASSILGHMAIVLITAYRLSPEEEDEVVAKAKADLLMYKPLPTMLELRQKMDDVVAQHRKEPEPEPESEKAEVSTPESKQAASQALKESQDAEAEPVQTPSTKAESSEAPEKPASQDGK